MENKRTCHLTCFEKKTLNLELRLSLYDVARKKRRYLDMACSSRP